MSAPAPERRRAYRRGTRGEGLAAAFLRLKGYRIVAKRFKTPVGEIDLIAKKRNTLVFVEVKARGRADEGLEAITPRQQGRVRRAAEYFIAAHPGLAALDMRFDAVVVLSRFRARHLPDAWGI